MKKQIFLFITCALLCVSKYYAQKPAMVISDKTGWHKIAETKVNFEKETDEVSVLIADKFAAMRFKVKQAPIDLRELMIYFEDGSDQKITIGSHLKKAGESSREIDLKGMEEKRIKSIVVTYSTAGAAKKGKKARLEIWGKKTNLDKDREKPKAEKNDRDKEKTNDK